MSHTLTAADARTVAFADLIVHNEVDYIERQIIAAGLNGDINVSVTDGTTMTNSTPTITVTGTEVAPTVTNTNTIILVGETVILGTTGLSLNAVIADINDAAITGITASKNAGNQLVITYEPTQALWSLVIGAGTANVELGITAGTVTADTPDSVSYYNAWTNDIPDRKLATQMAQVVNHFQNEGFSIMQKKNTTSAGNTLYWELFW